MVQINENIIMQKLETEMGKILSLEKVVHIAICGGTSELREQLASAVFGEKNASECCTFYETTQEINFENLDVIWSFNDFVDGEIPCFTIGKLSEEKINEVINWTADILPDNILEMGKQTSFIRRQKIDVNLKARHVSKMIKKHCVISFGVGFNPFTFGLSDAPILLANEMILMSRILLFYDLGSVNDLIKSLGTSFVAKTVFTTIGKGVTGVLKNFIPGIGHLINGGVASAIILAFGNSVSLAAKALCTADLENNKEQVKYVCDNFSEAVTGATLQFIEDGKTKAEDYTEEEIVNYSMQDFTQSIKKGNEAFQKFLDENYKLDDEFSESQKKDEQLSDDMWDAISEI